MLPIKNEVLEILEKNKNTSISGTEIAARLSVTRNTVWKAIKQLQCDGFHIEGVNNRGYCLSGECAPLSPTEITAHLNTAKIGRSLKLFQSVDSTNIAARSAAAAGSPHGTAIISEMQTAGKGRLGRSFFAPKGGGLYMSIILRPQLAADSAALLTTVAAVAVARAIESVADVKAEIKWVNDVFVGGKKICGILTEAVMGMESGVVEYAVVGIGINVLTQDFGEFDGVATSIALQTGRGLSRSVLAAEVMNNFETLYDILPDKTFLEEYRRRSNILGKSVTVICAGEAPYAATAVRIDENAGLVVSADGTERVLGAGEVSIRPL